MNKVRRGDLPVDLPVTGMPANLSFGTKLATPATGVGLTVEAGKPRRELGPTDANENRPRRELTIADSLGTPDTDE